MMQRLGRRAGVPRLHAHLLRHTFATMYLVNGGDVFTLQRILGHTTLVMVNHYLHIASAQVAIRHGTFSPMDNLDVGTEATRARPVSQRLSEGRRKLALVK